MSNPTKGASDTIEPQSDYYGVPLGSFVDIEIEQINSAMKQYRTPHLVYSALKGKEVRIGPTVFHSQEYSRNREALAKLLVGKPAYVVSPLGRVHFSSRTRMRARAFRASVPHLPEYYYNDGFKEVIANTFYAGGGTQLIMGRLLKHLPSKVKVGARLPPSESEAEEAVRVCGWDMGHVPKVDRVLIPLEDPGSGNPSLRVNKNAMLGSPFHAVPNREPDVLAQLMPYARGLYHTLKEAYSDDPVNGVRDLCTQLRRTDPGLMASITRVKTDFCTKEKLTKCELRPYSIAPAVPKTLSSQLIQTAERFARNVLDGSKYTSAQRMGLSHGNTNRLVRNLNAQYQRHRYAYATAGDDGIFFIQLGSNHVSFENDFTSFDNTQEKEVRGPVLGAFCNQLAVFSPQIAQLVFELHSVKPMVLCGAANLEFQSGGCTGFPGQGEINDLLNAVFARRLVTALHITWETGEKPAIISCEELAEMVQEAAEKQAGLLGFKAKVTNVNVSSRCKTPGDMIEASPTKFLGYYIGAAWQGEPAVRSWVPSMDPERFFARVLWKSNPERPSDAVEVASLAGMALSLGTPNHFEGKWWHEAYQAFVKFVAEQLQAMHDSGVAFPVSVEDAINGLVYMGVVAHDHTWKSMFEALLNMEQIWEHPLHTPQPFRMSHDAGMAEVESVQVPLYNPKVTATFGDRWADDLDGPVTDPQTAEMLPVSAEGRRPVKTYVVKPMNFTPIGEKHVGKVPPSHPPRPPPNPMAQVSRVPKRVALRQPTVVEDEEFYEDSVANSQWDEESEATYASLVEELRWEEEYRRDDRSERSVDFELEDQFSYDEQKAAQEDWEDPQGLPSSKAS